MKKKIGKKIGAATLALITLSSSTVALADTGGGIGDNSNAGTVTNGFAWNSAAYNTQGKAYNEFIKRAGWSKSSVDSQIVQRVGNLEVCKNSNVIWWVTSSGKWYGNFSGRTHGADWAVTGKGTIENPAAKFGDRAPSVAEVNAFKTWDKTKNGNKIEKIPGYTIICSGAYQRPDKVWTTTETSSKDANNSIEITNPYSRNVEIKPQLLVNGKDPIGVANLHTQSGGSKKTNYGLLWDKVNTTKDAGLSPTALKQQVQTALDKDAKETHSNISLDDANKSGMAEGGILNVYERTQYATLTSTETTTTKTTKTCTHKQTWNISTQKYNPETVNCTSKDAVTKKSTVVKKNGTLKDTGFWQMLSVHCNQAQFDALVKSDAEIKQVSTGDASHAISAVAYSKQYDSQPSVLDFGDPNNTNSAKKATASLGFYDKECPFDCTASSTAVGASGNNGAVNNTGSKNVSTTQNAKYGAVSEGKNNNNFEFFRDNKQHKISIDSWYPKTDGVVSYNGSAPLTTTITRWASGTPSVTDSEGGRFTMKTTDGKKLFTGNDSTDLTQKNWAFKEFSNPTTTVLKGLYKDFIVQSTWASDSGKPQQLNVKWEYAPSVSTNILANNIGFGVGSARNIGTVAKVSTDIQGKCYANYGTDKQLSTIKELGENTGTGTNNNLDSILIQGAGNNQTNLIVNFVRSTTE